MKNPSKPSTKKSSNSQKSAKNSRQNWLNSLVNGDKVWRSAGLLSAGLPSIDSLDDINYFVTEEKFGGWFTLQGRKGNAWLKCPYDGGFEVSTKTLFKTKQEAQKSAAPKVLKAIEKYANRLKKELKQLDKQHKRWQILAND